jgi:hypothetical protein
MQNEHQYEEECVGEECADELIARSQQAPLRQARNHLPDMAKDESGLRNRLFLLNASDL